MKKMTLVIFLFLTAIISVNASFPASITISTERNNSNRIPGSAGWATYFKQGYDSSNNYYTVYCSNHYKTSPNIGTTCWKSVSWSDAMKAAMASIIRSAGSPTSGTGYLYTTIAMSKFQKDNGQSGVTFSANCGETSCPSTWRSDAQTVYNAVNNAESHISVSIGTVTYTEDDTAFYLTIPITDDYNTSTSVSVSHSAVEQSDGTYKILKSDLNEGANDITITARAIYETYIAENYDCGSSNQPVTPTHTEKAVVAEDTDTETVTLTNKKKHTLDINVVIDGELKYSFSDDVYATSNFSVGGKSIWKESFKDHSEDYVEGSSYSITNILAKDGYEYKGYNVDDHGRGGIDSTDNTIEGQINEFTAITLTFETTASYTIKKINSRNQKVMGEVIFNVYSDELCTQNLNKQIKVSNGSGTATLPVGTLYIQEQSAPDSYHVDTTCKPITVTKEGTNEITITNKTECEFDFESDSTILNRIAKFNEKYSNFNKLLDFRIDNSTEACNRYVPTYSKSDVCLVSSQNLITTNEFSASDLSSFNDKVQKDSVDVGFCLTKFKIENPVSMPTNSVKAGRLVIGSETNSYALTGVLTKTCYVYNDISSDFEDSKKYSDYVSNITIGGNVLTSSSTGDRLLMKYIQTETNGLKKFEVEKRINYYFPEVNVYKLSGKPSCASPENCTFVGYGIISEFRDAKQSTGQFNFEVNFNEVNNLNSSATNNQKIFVESNSECIYGVEPEIIKYKADDNGKLDLEFRIIDTNNPYNRNTKYNWSDGMDNSQNNKTVQDEILNETNSYGVKEGVGNQTPKYTIILTPDIVDDIRDDNIENPYDEYYKSCTAGSSCKSKSQFIHDLYLKGVIK